MSVDTTKSCADFLRTKYEFEIGEKLKASHSHELVAAYFGYDSRAALLAERNYPLDNLEDAFVLVPDVSRIESRRACLDGLPPGLPKSKDLAETISKHLVDEGMFGGKVWLYESLELYVMEVLLPEKEGYISDELSGVIADTNAYFDETIYDSANVEDTGDVVSLRIEGQMNGSTDDDRMFLGDQIDMIVKVDLYRVAGRIAFSDPDISVSGRVNDDDYYD